MGVLEQGARTPVGRSLITRVAIRGAQILGVAAAGVVGIYTAWRSEAPTTPENRQHIEQINRNRAADPGIQRDQGIGRIQQQQIEANQDLTRQRAIETEIREQARREGRTVTEDDVQAGVRRRLTELESAPVGNRPGRLQQPATPQQGTMIWRDEVCTANGLPPTSTPNSNRFNELAVDCSTRLVRDGQNRTAVTIETYRRDAQGQIIVENRRVDDQNRPVPGFGLPIVDRTTVTGNVVATATGERVVIPGDRTFAGADNIIVQVADPASPARPVQSVINVGQNRDAMARFTQ